MLNHFIYHKCNSYTRFLNNIKLFRVRQFTDGSTVTEKDYTHLAKGKAADDIKQQHLYHVHLFAVEG